jgi:hypothetical protein
MRTKPGGILHPAFIFMKHFPVILTFAIFGSLVGCAPKDQPEVLEAVKNAPAEFKGKVDPQLVGQWVTKDSKSHLLLEEDGKARIQATIGTRIGPQKVDSRQEWKVDSGTMYFKDENGVVTQYKIKFSGTELELKSLRSSTVYIKGK